MKTFTRRKTQSLLIAHGHYSGIANCQTKVPAIFQGIFGFFAVFLKYLRICSTNLCGTLVGKHCCNVIRTEYCLTA